MNLMGEDYGKALNRLEDERLEYKITQGKMGKMLKMTQSHYYKAANGEKRFGYYELQAMCNSELDVYHIFTGKRSRRKDYFDALFWEADYEQLLVCLKIIHMVAGANKRAGADAKEWERIFKDTHYIEYALYIIAEEQNVFKAVRTYKGIKQMDMAEALAMDVKKLRALESNHILPDSELIFKMYGSYGVSPALFLKDAKCLQNEICFLTDSVGEKVQQKLIDCVKFALSNSLV